MRSHSVVLFQSEERQEKHSVPLSDCQLDEAELFVRKGNAAVDVFRGNRPRQGCVFVF